MSYREIGSTQTDSRQIYQPDYQTAWYQELIMILHIRFITAIFQTLYHIGVIFPFQINLPIHCHGNKFFHPGVFKYILL